jgi:hypothetical protein
MKGTNLNKEKQIRLQHIVFACLLIISISILGCRATRGLNKKKNKVTYELFDSLENYYLADIKEHAPQKPKCIIIDPSCLINLKVPNHKNVHFTNNLYNIALCYDLDPIYDAVLKKTNNLFLIGKEYYPVFVMGIDDYFLLNGNKNIQRGKSPTRPRLQRGCYVRALATPV